MFSTSWESVGRSVLLAVIVYVFVVAALRVVGIRALAKMSAYDLVVTIALGSLIATIPLQSRISVIDGVLVIATFLVLQRVASRLLTESPAARHLVKSRPILVAFRGQMLRERMDAERINEEEVRAAVRAAGLGSLAQCAAVVLENDGTWSVIPRSDGADLSALRELDLPAPWPEAMPGD